jgi:hypothetical protein
MLTMLIASALLFCTGQAGTDAPPARTAYSIILENGKQLHGFWEERQELAEGSVRVELDTPWAPGFEIIRESEIVSTGVERGKAREDRILEGWKSAGFTLVEGRPIPTVEVELANRAREMAGVGQNSESVPAQAVDILPAAPEPAAAAVAVTESASIARRWGGQVAIVAVALLLAGVIVKALILS